MLPASDKFKDIAERGHAKLAAIFQIATTSASAQLQTSFDWISGVQQGTPGTDFPTTTTAEAVSVDETDIEPVDSSEFSWPDDRSLEDGGHPEAFVILDNGVDPIEIASYTSLGGVTGAFENMVRGRFGTEPITMDIGDDIHQLVFDPILTAGNDLGIQFKGYAKPATTGGPPDRRFGHGVVYDIGNGQIILFGGFDDDPSTYYNDVWVYDIANRTWTEKTPAGGPTGRFNFAMSWDTVREVAVITGGATGDATGDEVWEYDPNTGAEGTWTQVDNLIDDLSRHQSFYDPVRELVFVFGVGFDSNVYTYDHSETPGSQWTEIGSLPWNIQVYPRGEWLPIDGIFWLVGSRNSTNVQTFNYDPATENFQTGFDNALGVLVNQGATQAVMSHDAVNKTIFMEYHASSSSSTARSQFYRIGVDSWIRHVNSPDTNDQGVYGAACAWDVTAQQFFRWGGLNNASLFNYNEDDPVFFRWHWPDIEWLGPVMDMGLVPDVNGKITFSDFFPSTGTNLMEISLEYADAPGGPFTGIGVVTNAQILTDMKRYWRPTLVIETDSIFSPSIQKIRISFDDLLNLCLCDNPIFDAETIVMDIPALSLELDPLKAQSSISEMQIELDNRDGRAKELIQKFRIYNRQASILIGFDEPGMTIDDFMPYNSGVVHKWKGDDADSNQVTIIFRDPLQILEDTKVPPDENEGQPTPIVYVDGQITHPVLIEKDLLENQINVPAHFLDLASFDQAALHPTLTDWAFIRTIDDSEKGRDLMEELAQLSAAYVVPTEEGQLRVFVYDPTGQPVAELGRKDFVQGSLKFDFDDENLKNAAACYYGWDGGGEKAENFVEAIVALDADSENAFNKTATESIRPKWLGTDVSPYFGKARATDIATRFTTQYANGLPVLRFKTSLRWLQLQIGDLVRVTGDPDDPDWTVPYLMFGVDTVQDFKFLVIKKTVSYTEGEIDFTLWRAYEDLEIDIDTQGEFEGAFI